MGRFSYIFFFGFCPVGLVVIFNYPSIIEFRPYCCHQFMCKEDLLRPRCQVLIRTIVLLIHKTFVFDFDACQLMANVKIETCLDLFTLLDSIFITTFIEKPPTRYQYQQNSNIQKL